MVALGARLRHMLDGASVTHTDFLEQVDAYALGAVEPDEARALADHLRDEGPHPDCEAALARASQTAAALAGDLTPVPLPPRVWSAIARATAPTPLPRRRIPWWTYGVAAAAVALWVLGGVLLRRAQSTAELASVTAAQCARELAAARIDALRKEDALKLLVEPGTQLVALKPAAAGQASTPGSGVVIFNPRGRALFLGQRFATDPTRDYELWLLRDGRPVAAGLLPAGPEGEVLVDVRPEVLAGSRPAGFAVSVERKGGETQAPRGPVILTGALGAP
jgi:hypothetical protein